MGTGATRDFYDQVGWRQESGVTREAELFGDPEIGPIRKELRESRLIRIRAALSLAGSHLRILECGCGGNPILLRCPNKGWDYTGVDFSQTGLAVAERLLTDSSIKHRLLKADICRLPFSAGEFDAVYSSNVLYHLDDPKAQRAALREMVRVLRPRGVAVLILGNPRPLLFWGRLARRVAADTPGISNLLNRLRRKPPLPFRPMRIAWYRDILSEYGEVRVLCYALESVWFNQHVSERHALGRFLLRAIQFAERSPGRIAPLGCYTQLVFQKSG